MRQIHDSTQVRRPSKHTTCKFFLQDQVRARRSERSELTMQETAKLLIERIQIYNDKVKILWKYNFMEQA